MHVDPVDTTNFNSSGCRENIAGLASGTISAEGPYDQGVMAFAAGNSYTFALNAGSSSFSVTARITDITPSVNVEGAGMIQIEAVTTGSFTPAVAGA